jgi:hypothetical protein
MLHKCRNPVTKKDYDDIGSYDDLVADDFLSVKVVSNNEGNASGQGALTPEGLLMFDMNDTRVDWICPDKENKHGPEGNRTSKQVEAKGMRIGRRSECSKKWRSKLMEKDTNKGNTRDESIAVRYQCMINYKLQNLKGSHPKMK